VLLGPVKRAARAFCLMTSKDAAPIRSWAISYSRVSRVSLTAGLSVQSATRTPLVHRGVWSLVAHDDPDEADLDRQPGAEGGVADRLDDVVCVQASYAGDELWRETQL
jgi:hypothetical protein